MVPEVYEFQKVKNNQTIKILINYSFFFFDLIVFNLSNQSAIKARDLWRTSSLTGGKRDVARHSHTTDRTTKTLACGMQCRGAP